MKLIILIVCVVIVGVASEKPEATSAVPSSSSTLAATTTTAAAPNRRDGISYSTSVIHRDPKHPDAEAASSIDFRLNTSAKSKDQKESAAFISYPSTPKPTFHPDVNAFQLNDYAASSSSQSASDESESLEHHAATKTGDVIYGQNAVNQPPYHIHQQTQVAATYTKTPTHSNHQPYYRPLSYAQPQLTETYQKIEVSHPTPTYKHSANVHKTLTTPRSRTTSSMNHRRPAAYSQPVTSHSNPQPQAQAYTQAIYHKPADLIKAGKAISFSNSNTALPSHGQSGHQTQSFNVGYSVKFGNEHNSAKKPFKASRVESDIITGSHKEEVSKPSHLHTYLPDDKYMYAASTPQQIISPKAQKQLSFLDTIHKTKFAQKEPVQSNFPWKNLSPSVEIFKSNEVPASVAKTSSYFDHEKAIGKSEGFDYTNAMGADYMQKVQQQAQAAQTIANSYIPPHETHQYETSASPYLQISDPGHPGSDKLPALPKLPIDTSLIREPFLTVHKESMHAQQGSKLPIHFDTSLIKDMAHEYAHLYEGYQTHTPSVSESSAVGSATFQENLAQLNNLLAEQSQQQSSYHQLVPAATQSAQTSTSEPNLYLVPHQQTPVNKELEMSFSYPQNGLFNPNLQQHMVTLVQKPTEPSNPTTFYTPTNVKLIDPQLLKHLKMYKVKEHQQDHSQPPQIKFKVFGKPGNAFMRHQYEKMRLERPLRMPTAMIPTSKRIIRDYTNIEMDLRPPPVSIPFKAANFIRIK